MWPYQPQDLEFPGIRSKGVKIKLPKEYHLAIRIFFEKLLPKNQIHLDTSETEATMANRGAGTILGHMGYRVKTNNLHTKYPIQMFTS